MGNYIEYIHGVNDYNGRKNGHNFMSRSYKVYAFGRMWNSRKDIVKSKHNIHGINYTNFIKRMNSGETPEEALSRPSRKSGPKGYEYWMYGKRYKLVELSRIYNKDASVIVDRVKRFKKYYKELPKDRELELLLTTDVRRSFKYAPYKYTGDIEEYKGLEMPLEDWSDKIGIEYPKLFNYTRRRDFNAAVDFYFKQKKNKKKEFESEWWHRFEKKYLSADLTDLPSSVNFLKDAKGVKSW